MQPISYNDVLAFFCSNLSLLNIFCLIVVIFRMRAWTTTYMLRLFQKLAQTFYGLQLKQLYDVL